MDATGLVIKLVLDGETRDLAEELAIPLWNLSIELASQPSWYAFWSSMLAEAQIALDETKGQLDVLLAQVSSELRVNYKRMSLKVTEAQLDEEVMLDARVQSKKEELLRRRRSVELIKVAVKAFEQRAQTLITLGYRENKQLDVDPTIRVPEQERGPIAATRKQILEQMRYGSETEQAKAGGDLNRSGNRSGTTIGGKK